MDQSRGEGRGKKHAANKKGVDEGTRRGNFADTVLVYL